MKRVADQLAQLENAELVRPVPDEDWSYLFCHALTQESAYESLLLKKRHELHHLVADAYTQLYPERLDENAALLAQHYHLAGDDANVFVYAVRAGDAAARVFAYPEASAHYAEALDALTRLPDTETYLLARVDTLLKYVRVSLRAEGPVATLKRLAEAEALARPMAEREQATRADRLRLARVRYWRGQALIHQNEMRAAVRELKQVLAVAQAEYDAQLLAMPASVIGRSLVAQGQFGKGLAILTQAIQALEQVHDDHEWIVATGFCGIARAMLGDCAAGIADAGRALTRATEANTLTGMALAHGAFGVAYLFANALPEANAHGRTMIEIAAESGDRLYAYTAHAFLAWSHTRAGDCAGADKEFAQAHAIAQQVGGKLLFADWFAAARAEHALRCGRTEQALSLAGTVSQRAHREGGVFAEGLAERIRGQALAAQASPRLDGAQIHLGNSLARLEEGGAQVEAARTRVALAQVLARQGNVPAAREQLEQAAAQFQVSGLDGELDQAKALAASLPQEGVS